jgi:outer membrane murein-binding lipoprotein Lpp
MNRGISTKRYALILTTLIIGVLIAGCSESASKEPVPTSANELRADRSKMTEEDKKKMEEGLKRAGESMKNRPKSQ